MVGWALAVCAVTMLAQCGSDRESGAIDEALRVTLDALKRSDFKALWATADATAQDKLLTLHRELESARQKVAAAYPHDDAAAHLAAREALGLTLLGDIPSDDPDAGPKILAKLMSPRLLRFDQHALDGATINDVTVKADAEPPVAVVQTTAGERLVFAKTETGWRSLLVTELLTTHGVFKALRSNLEGLQAVEANQADAWAKTRDPKRPQGAYNLARDAVTKQPIDSSTLFSMIDDEARSAVLRALQDRA